MIIDNSGQTWIVQTGATSDVNGVRVMDDGSLRAIKTAAVYDDLVGNIFSANMYSNTGTVDYDWDEQCIEFQSSGDITDKNDRVAFNLQFIHKAVMGDDAYMRLHWHWFQASTDADFTFTLKHRIQNNGAVKNDTWTTISADTATVFNYTGATATDFGSVFSAPTSGTKNQITVFPEIDVTDCDVSSTIQFQISRTDSNSGTSLVSFIDAHILIDSDGSVDEFSKDGY